MNSVAQQSAPNTHPPTEGGSTMGAVKDLVQSLGEASLTLAELQDSEVSFVLTSAETGWSWFLAPTGSEYEQDDWIFHALRQGHSDTFEGACADLAEAAVAQYPEKPFAMVRKPQRTRRLKSVR